MKDKTLEHLEAELQQAKESLESAESNWVYHKHREYKSWEREYESDLTQEQQKQASEFARLDRLAVAEAATKVKEAERRIDTITQAIETVRDRNKLLLLVDCPWSSSLNDPC